MSRVLAIIVCAVLIVAGAIMIDRSFPPAASETRHPLSGEYFGSFLAQYRAEGYRLFWIVIPCEGDRQAAENYSKAWYPDQERGDVIITLPSPELKGGARTGDLLNGKRVLIFLGSSCGQPVDPPFAPLPSENPRPSGEQNA